MPHPWDEGVRGTQVPILINSDAPTLRCVAGPGSGKTFGLVRRVERILHPVGLGVDGHDMLVIAFNRVIARQLRDDIHARLKTFDCKHEPIIRTIHALCVEVIGEDLRMLLPHEVDAMIYDVLHEYPEVAALYDDFDDAGQALRDHDAGHAQHLVLDGRPAMACAAQGASCRRPSAPSFGTLKRRRLPRTGLRARNR